VWAQMLSNRTCVCIEPPIHRYLYALFSCKCFSFIVDPLNPTALKLACNCCFLTFPAVPSEMVDRGYTVWCGWNTGAKSVNCNASGIEVCRLCQDTGKILLNKQYLADNGWRFHIPGSSHVVS